MPADEVLYNVAMQRLAEQMERVDKLDTMLATVFSFAFADLPIFGALLTTQADPRAAAVALYISAVIVYS